ncbi:hypothetical protein Q73_11040 [Bacillus coahuilensis m2-6]|uniref:signal peptide peptidase SppA n=1 Tax=Bacillus coahuilensis TaxID=408580 RepID=UPI0007505B6F|nr:signal peptide peptidase SppA [Bacillus coahuilensis]KUP06681.1 hypothetical protein Q73_11040 [Bacillus coahuilensis m2-6]
MSGKRWTALVIAVGLFFVSIVVNLATTALSTDFTSSLESMLETPENGVVETILEEGSASKRIAVLEVNGVIQDTGDVASFFESPTYNHRQFMDQLEVIKEDKTIQGVVLRVNSPGGGTAESAQIHQKLVELKEEAEIPVYVSMGSIAASGGYYISAPADKIFAMGETLTGSLGVIMQSLNYSGLAEEYGVEMVTIKSGPYKDILSPTREVTEEERNILQSMIDNSYEAFVDVIATGRDMSEAEVKRIADGRIYDGYQAKENNLIDEFGYYEDALEALKKDHDLNGAQVFEYSTGMGFESLFSYSAQSVFGKDMESRMLMDFLSKSSGPRLMYLYAE